MITNLREYINEKKGRPTAWVIVYTPKKLIMGLRSPGANNPNQWNFFGGGIDMGESPAEAACRELREETTYVANPSELKEVARIGDAIYFSLRVEDEAGFGTTTEISKLAKFKLTDLPNNMHQKTQNFFTSLDVLFNK